MGEFNIGDVTVGNSRPFTLIAGPCVIESEALCNDVAEKVLRACTRFGIEFIFKASFDKANRTSGKSFRGPGIAEGLQVLAKIRARFGVPVLVQGEGAVYASGSRATPQFISRNTCVAVLSIS